MEEKEEKAEVKLSMKILVPVFFILMLVLSLVLPGSLALFVSRAGWVFSSLASITFPLWINRAIKNIEREIR